MTNSTTRPMRARHLISFGVRPGKSSFSRLPAGMRQRRGFAAHLALAPLGEEIVALDQCRGRVLARDVAAEVDVPSFDRSNVDGFAVRAVDVEGARPDAPRRLKLNGEVLTPGKVPQQTIAPGTATIIATGGMIARGADAVVMVEQTEFVGDAEGSNVDDPAVDVFQPLVPGAHISVAGSDIGAGETVLRTGTVLGSREVAVLAAIGLNDVPVFRQPRVAILSTGDELVKPGEAIRPGQVYDSNGPMLIAAVQELGCIAMSFGIVADDPGQHGCGDRSGDRRCRCRAALGRYVERGGRHRLSYGFAFHRSRHRRARCGTEAGQAAVPWRSRKASPWSSCPDFRHRRHSPSTNLSPRSCAPSPVCRLLRRESRTATLPVKMVSELGRTEYVLVSLTERPEGGLAAYPIGKTSGAVTAFSLADGFFAIPAQSEIAPMGSEVSVTLTGKAAGPADLMIIGSHCVGLDYLIGLLAREGLTAKVLAVGSMAGLMAAKRGECDIAGIHLMDPATGVYNRPYLDETLHLVRGYGRLQGVVYRAGDTRFEGRDAAAAIAVASRDPACLMVNRNAGSGTRILVDRLLGEARPAGYSSPNPVAQCGGGGHCAKACGLGRGDRDGGAALRTGFLAVTG